MGARALLIGFGKFCAVVALGLAAGGGIGLGLAELTGAEEPIPSVSDVGTATPSPTATPGPEIEVLASDLLEAQTASGRARQRARVSVRVRLVNTTDDELTVERPELVVSSGRTPADPAADLFTGTLLDPVAPGDRATGLLRFETAGAVTEQIAEEGQARLEIAGESVLVRFTV